MKHRWDNLALGLFLYTLTLASICDAQVQTLPTEQIESKPIVTFSDETGVWPTQTYASESILLPQMHPFESLSRLPGIEARSNWSKSSPGISLRGASSANRTLILYDGIPINLADGIGGQEFLIPHESIGQVNVVKGPSSVYFGANAMSGGVNFVPEFYKHSRVRGTVGSGQLGGFGAASLLSDDRHQVQLTTYNESFDGIRARADTHTQRATLSGNHNLSGYKVGYRYLRVEEFGSSPGPVTQLDPLSSKRTGEIFGLKADKEINTNVFLRVSGSQVRTESHYFTESSQLAYDSRAAQTRAGLSLGFLNSDGISPTLFYDYTEDFLNTSSTQNQNYIMPSHEPGLLIQMPFSETIVLQAGTRYLPYYGIFPSTVGAVQNENSKKFWVTYSEGFRPPSLSDKYDRFGSFQGNPNLKPERSYQIELGASAQGLHTSSNFIQHLDYEVSLFSTSYDDLITREGNTLKNALFARAWGGEGTLTYPLAVWNFGVGYSYLEATADGAPLPFTTNQKISPLVAHYFGPLIFELIDTVWINYRQSAAPQDKFSWNTVDFIVRTQGLSDWNFSAGALNMLGTPVEYVTGYPEPKQRFFLSVERMF